MTSNSTTNREACYIGLGSNLELPQQQLERACISLTKIPHTQFVSHSPWYESKAVGPGVQPNYLNGVAYLLTKLDPNTLLGELQRIESDQGRKRDVRWGARTLDLDILLFGSRVIDSEHLVVPHPRLEERNFVIYPLGDLAPELILPSGNPIDSLKKKLSTEGLALL